jgi:hypothetical protein
MKPRVRRAVLSAVFVVCFPSALHLHAETKPVPPAAPVPAPILQAKKIFIANAGGEQPWYSDGQFSGGTDRAYNQFYAAVKARGRYESRCYSRRS